MMFFLRYIFTALACVVCLCSRATEPDTLRFSVLTCMPGPEIYELDGHSALRVCSPDGDMIWNYGLFSFDQPNFVYRFVKGETDYMVGAYPTAYFLPEYAERGSRVYEQVLNLTSEEKEKLLDLIMTDLTPENRVYRYNYILDNCATRIRDHVENAAGGVVYDDSVHFGTFRKQMSADHADYPWYQFGIDLALASGLDRPVTVREEMFTPLEMRCRFAAARRADGQPLVSETNILVEGGEAAIDAPTPWYLTPLAIFSVLAVCILCVVIYQIRSGKMIRWVYALWYGVFGLAGCVIAFLVFISTHEATDGNILLLILNPLQLIIPVCIWSRKTQGAVRAMMIYNVIFTSLLLLLWPLILQRLNLALLPLFLANLLLSLSQAMVKTKRKSS